RRDDLVVAAFEHAEQHERLEAPVPGAGTADARTRLRGPFQPRRPPHRALVPADTLRGAESSELSFLLPFQRATRRPMPEQTVQKPGRIVEIKGVVVDVVFPEGLPEIYTALSIDIPARDGQEERSIIAEIQQHL